MEDAGSCQGITEDTVAIVSMIYLQLGAMLTVLSVPIGQQHQARVKSFLTDHFDKSVPHMCPPTICSYSKFTSGSPVQYAFQPAMLQRPSDSTD